MQLDPNNEVWKDIPGYDGNIQISNLGRLRRLWLFKWRYYNPSLNGSGYYQVKLRYRGKTSYPLVHVLVAQAFLDKKSQKDLIVHHKDSIKTNNIPDNLEYVTRQYNIQHMWDVGLRERRFFTEEEISDIKTLGKRGVTFENIAKKYNVRGVTISRIYYDDRNFIKKVV